MRTWVELSIALASICDFGQENSTPKEEDTPQVKALRVMQKMLKEKDWEKFYADYCHPDLRKQLTSDKFKAYMAGPKGQPVVDVFDEVLKAVDAKADKTVLVAQPQDEKGQYEFILVQVKNLSPVERKGRQWHLELELDEGRWKFLDTD